MLADLIPDIQDKILNYCSTTDLKSLSVTCREFNAVAAPYLFREVFISPASINKQIPNNFRVAETVHVHGAPKGTILNKKYLKTLGLVDDLRTLVLVNVITDASLQALGGQSPKVNTVFLLTTSEYLSEKVGQFDTYIKSLQSFPELYVLRCMFKDISDVGLSHVCCLETLRKLDLHQCNFITDQGISKLVCLKNLQELFVRSCREITGSGFSGLRKLPRLYKLDVSHSPIDVQGFETISQLPCLGDLTALGYGVRREQFLIITTMTSLQKLCIGDGRSLDNEISSEITSLVMLKEVTLDGGWVSQGLLNEIAKLPRLKKLTLISGHLKQHDLSLFVDVDICQPVWDEYLKTTGVEFYQA